MLYNQLSNRQKAYVDAVIEHAPALGVDLNKTDFSRAELRQVSMTLKGKKWIPNWITHDVSRRTGRGVFAIPEIMDAISVSPGQENSDDMESDVVVMPSHIEDDPQADVETQAMEELHIA
jgi:hypothetical protein